MVLLHRRIDSFEVNAMRKSNLTACLFGIAGMLAIILDGKTAVAGVQEGLELCIRTLIPSLFPFFVLSALVTGSLSGIAIRPLRWVCALCRIPVGAESLLLVGILGGYPVGAGNLAAQYRCGNLSLEDAQRMSVFCNNAGPSFLFGILGTLFPHIGWVWALWGIQIISALLTGILLPGDSPRSVSLPNAQEVSLPDALNRSIKSMASVCGWVLLFRLILTFLGRWILWLIPDPVRVFITGFLELSNGCLALSVIESVEIRFILAGIMLSLGGICVWMQTQAVFPSLSLPYYIAGRALHCLFSMLLCLSVALVTEGNRFILCPFILLFAGSGMFVLVYFLRKQKIAVAFCKRLMYNGL